MGNETFYGDGLKNQRFNDTYQFRPIGGAANLLIFDFEITHFRLAAGSCY